MSFAAINLEKKDSPKSGIGLFVTDTEGLCLWVSQEFCELVGLSANEILGQFWFRILDPLTRNHAIQSWEEVIVNSRNYSLQTVITTPHKKQRTILIQAASVPKQQSRQAYCVGMLLDATSLAAQFAAHQRHDRLSETIHGLEIKDKEITKLYSTLNELETTQTKLTDELQVAKERARVAAEKAETTSKTVESLNQQLTSNNEEKFELKKQCDTLTQELAQLKQERENLQTSLKQMNESISALDSAAKDERQALKHSEIELHNKIAQLELTIEKDRVTNKQKLEQQEADFKANKAQLEAQLLKMLGEASDLLNTKKELEQKVLTLNQTIESQRAEQAKIQQNYDAERKLADDTTARRIESLKSDHELLKQTKNDLSIKFCQLEVERDHELASIEQQKRTIEKLSVENQLLSKQLSEANLTIEESKVAIRKISHESLAEEDRMYRANAELDAEKASSADLKKQIKELQESLNLVTAERGLLEQQLSTYNSNQGPAISALEQTALAVHNLFAELFGTLPKIQLTPEQSQATADLRSSADYVSKLIAASARILSCQSATPPTASDLVAVRRVFGPLAAVFDFRSSQKDIQFKYSIDPKIPESLYGDLQTFETSIYLTLGGLIRQLPNESQISCSIIPEGLADQLVNLHLSIEVSGINDSVKFQEITTNLSSPAIDKLDALGFYLAQSALNRSCGTFHSRNLPAENKLLIRLSFQLKSASNETAREQSPRQQAISPSKQAAIELSKLAPQTKANLAALAGNPHVATKTRIRVLLAEDNKISQNIISKLLNANNCEVTVAINGRDAFEKLERGDYDLVLMDCQMPMVDGFQATSLIRRFEKEKGRTALPIYGLSAQVEEGINIRCQAVGMNACLSKPLQENRLLEILGKIKVA